MKSARRLNIVADKEQLRGIGSSTFERLLAQAHPGDRNHRGIAHVLLTLAGPVVRACVPPSAQSELWAGLFAGRTWVTSGLSDRELGEARARTFGAVSAIEALTEKAVAAALPHVDPGAKTPLDTHATRVTLRYARLGAHFATSAVCHALDGLQKPAQLLEVYSDLQAARAYQLTGLGAARHAAFRQAAWEQARWELSRHKSDRPSDGDDPMAIGGLAVQVFHEYLGGRYRAQAEAVRADLDTFIAWALPEQANGSSRDKTV